MTYHFAMSSNPISDIHLSSETHKTHGSLIGRDGGATETASDHSKRSQKDKSTRRITHNCVPADSIVNTISALNAFGDLLGTSAIIG